MHIYINPYVFVADARLPKGRVRRKDKYINICVDVCIYMYIYVYIHPYACISI